ncbi:MAG TPA: 5'-methylthioadenosine/S-adenosylhomocysteine nucleosidase [Amaricoccus sp.]|nr:5'-methylthioadenosine/S-adenosylhomocysteine nucleosidase [Amaricoccus sp.]
MILEPARARTNDIGGRPVHFLMAADAEYGPALRARIQPLRTGVGPVEAALATAVALAGLSAAGRLPALAVCLGSAGSRTLEQGAVYQASSVSWRDIDASALGFAKGVTPFLDREPETRLPTPLSLPSARLSTGGTIVTGDAYGSIDADMGDMETYAVLRACEHFGVPLIGLRGISDGAEDLRHYDGWAALLPALDGHLATAVDELAATLAAGWTQGRG